MKRNNWHRSNTPITEYEVSSKGIRRIRTIMPGEKPKTDLKPATGDGGEQAMKQNNWVTNNTPITEYEVSSKGIRHLRAFMPGKKKPKDDSKPAKDDKKRDKPE